ncbi:hypothetical protein EXS74_00860 [Candidatus Woesearchaeota archaeon]|nr:hypothetical protein [Candidatus Woesearchaeota archaeon]
MRGSRLYLPYARGDDGSPIFSALIRDLSDVETELTSRDLAGYLVVQAVHLRDQDRMNFLERSLRDLPWHEYINGRIATRAYNALGNHLGRSTQTIGDGVRCFEEIASRRGQAVIKNYGRKCHEATEWVYGKMGIQLPKLPVK